MAKPNKEVFEILSNLKVPVIAGYDNQSEIPKQSFIGYHKCEECKANVVVNCLDAPACPVCAGALHNVGEDTNIVVSNDDFSKLKTLCSCDSCGTTWAGKEDILAGLANHSLYCPVCVQPMIVKAADNPYTSNNNDSKDDSTKSDTDNDNKTDDSNDSTTDADKELDEALKKLNLKDNDDSNKTETTSSDEDEDEEDNESDEEDDSDDESEETDASDLIYAMALKDAKNVAVISDKNFSRWYMFNNKTPIAIAEFENAQASIQSIFRSNDYVIALESAINGDGGLNNELMKDFGFEPVKIDLKIDDLSKKIIEEEVANKTKQANEKLENLAGIYDQAIGTAAIGITKGIYDNGENFRNSLIATFVQNNVREPERMVDNFLEKNLPNLMKNTVLLAKELMNKSPEALAEVAAMVVSSKPRAISPVEKHKIPSLAIHSSQNDIDNIDENREKRNLKRERVSASDKEAARTVNGLFKSVNTNVNV